MGSCASADKSRPGPPMKLVAFGTRADSLVNPESPKEVNSAPLSNPPETAPDDGGVPVKSRPSFCSAEKSLGSKGETFFDSQAWLESDDEFHSVNGDFTPSRGNTPKNSFSERLPRVHNLLFEEKPRSPLLRRKKLGELFRDSIREEREDSSEGSPENQRERSERSSSAGDTPRASGANSSAIDDDSANKREKGLKSANGCLPGFVSCGSFSEKRKKMIPAAVAVK
ncbi:PREDICTED: uncharacterized protein At3g27210-like isoform X2 [Tarenaya hassleriana]|uniref:uncharacterized protein At3g27210-like isoform X2 n=1 Tax=Tarenaya hassleriana TaxID=28532 RepID=UPI00053C64D3|nr:PREDICTED: uncharacterized protein At3g27210-like isoform X2 [Tarenaya hassleriana]